MATNTPNYNLIKPDGNDPVNIADFNGNSDIIDATLKYLNDRALPISNQSQAQSGTDNSTLMTPLRVLESIVYNGQKFFNSTENNLNNLKKSGNYYFANTVNPSNSPYPNGTAFYIEVLNRNQEDFSIQTSHRTNTTEIYTRSLRFDGAWTAWVPLNFNIATQAQAQTGSDNATVMTPLRTKQAIDNSSVNRFGIIGGTVNTALVTLNPGFTSIPVGFKFTVKNTITNTGNVTITVNGDSGGAKKLLTNEGAEIPPGKFKADAFYDVVWDGVNFRLVKGGGDSSLVKRVQRGTVNMTTGQTIATASISSVNLNKTIVKITFNFSSINEGTTNNIPNQLYTYAEITNATTITFNRSNASTSDISIKYEVIEFEDSVNIQKGTGTISNGENNTEFIISEVSVNKSEIIFSYNVATNDGLSQNFSADFQSATRLKIYRGSSLGVGTVKWQVITYPE